MTNDDRAPSAQPRLTRTAALILAASVIAVVVAGTGALAAVQLNSGTVAVGPTSEPTVVRPTLSLTPASTPTPSPTASQSAEPVESASGTDNSGGSGGSAGGSSGGSSGGSGGGGVTPPPPPPPPPPVEPAYTDADAQAAVVSWYGAIPSHGRCISSNYGTWTRNSAPPPPVYVGILGYDAGANSAGTGGWVAYYSCE